MPLNLQPASAPATGRKKKGEEEDDGPAVLHTVGKNQRIKDEKALKVCTDCDVYCVCKVFPHMI